MAAMFGAGFELQLAPAGCIERAHACLAMLFFMIEWARQQQQQQTKPFEHFA